MPDHKFIPRHLQEAVDLELESNEKIEWMEIPKESLLSQENMLLYIWGALLTSSILAIVYDLGIQKNELALGGYIIFAPFLILGLILLGIPFFTRIKQNNTVYLITNKRALIVEGIQQVISKSYPPHKLQNVYRKENSDGFGEVILEQQTSFNKDDTACLKQIGFEAVQNAFSINCMLRTLASQVDQKTKEKHMDFCCLNPTCTEIASDFEIPECFYDKLAKELDKDEEIQWLYAVPSKKITFVGMVLFMLKAPFFLVPIATLTGTTLLFITVWVVVQIPWYFLFLAVMFTILPSLWSSIKRRDKDVKYDALYVITDKRAITFLAEAMTTTIQSYTPEKLQNIHCNQKRDRIGDVIIFYPPWFIYENRTRYKELGFFNIKFPEEVTLMLQTLAAQAMAE